MTEKIAILTDSGSDVPASMMQTHPIFILPLQVNYKERSYRDGVDIDSKTVLENLHKEVPTTSLPFGEDLEHLVSIIKAQGFTRIVAIMLSSGLSGTCNMVQLYAKESEIPMDVFDTKNIGIGSGLTAIRAAQWVQDGLSFDELKANIEESIANTKVFFVLSTLEYLIKGGRIGKVSGFLGTALELKPLITCDDQGIYTTIAKVRGRQKSVKALQNKVESFFDPNKKYLIGIAHANASEDAQALKENLMVLFHDQATYFFSEISPALGVHTGPGLLGVGISIL
ncbi:MAG: DegV family protein [Erysipelothrix sp.]|jgi:DegV family protein with EDD domain|nr:DegV family protein [Erysipelothrix sp.]